MLVLTRKPSEKIHIGDNVVVTVVRTKGNAVRLGIEAPEHVSIVRGEIAADWSGRVVADVRLPSSVARRRVRAGVPRRSFVAASSPAGSFAPCPATALAGETLIGS
jgi:carbon storage regulator